MSSETQLVLEGTDVHHAELREFAKQTSSARLLKSRHIGGEIAVWKLFVATTSATIPLIAKFYLKLRELDNSVVVKVDGVEIRGIRDAKEIEAIINAIRSRVKNQEGDDH